MIVNNLKNVSLQQIFAIKKNFFFILNFFMINKSGSFF